MRRTIPHITLLLLFFLCLSACTLGGCTTVQPGDTGAAINSLIVSHETEVRLSSALATRLTISSLPTGQQIAVAKVANETANVIIQAVDSNSTDMTKINELILQLSGDSDVTKQIVGLLLYTAVDIADSEVKSIFANAPADSQAKAAQALLRGAATGVADATSTMAQLKMKLQAKLQALRKAKPVPAPAIAPKK